MIPGSASPFFLGSSLAVGGGGTPVQIERSLRFNSSDSAYLSRTPAVAGNRQKWTWAGWVKRSKIGSGYQNIFESEDNLPIDGFFFEDDTLKYRSYDGSSEVIQLKTTQVFRDTSAWYHLVFAIDTTQTTGSNRLKLYINGVQVTTFSTAIYGTPNYITGINSVSPHSIGMLANNNYFNGYLADIHFIDGQALDATAFTEVSATTGQLIPKAYAGTYTGNSFWLKFNDNSAATATTLGKDSFLLGNNWTPNNLSVTVTPNVNVTGFTATSGPGAGDNNAKEAFDGESNGYTLYAHGYGIHYITINTSTTPIPVQSSDTWTIYWGTSTVNPRDAQLKLTFAGGATTTYTAFTRTSGIQLNTITLGTTGSVTEIDLRETSSSNPGELYFRLIAKNGVPYIWNPGPENDSLVDTPTSYGTDTGAGGEVRGNYATLNPLLPTLTPTNGNLDTPNSAGQNYSTIAITTGKWYVETTVGPITAGTFCGLGLHFNPSADTGAGFYNSGAYIALLYENNLARYEGVNSAVNFYPTAGAGSILAIKIDLDSGTQTISYYVNNVLITSSNLPAGKTWFVTTRQNNNQSLNFGQRAFAYTAPSGFKALCDTNLGPPLVALPNKNFDIITYPGNGSTQTIPNATSTPATALDFGGVGQIGFSWIKQRSDPSTSHAIYDARRGVQARLESDTTDQEATSDNGVTAFNAGTIALGSQAQANSSSETYVAWCWATAAQDSSSHTQGSITSQVRANVSAGFSIVTWTGAGATATIGHGLGVEPHWIIVKNRTGSADNWSVYTKTYGAGNQIYLNLTNAVGGGSVFPSAPTSTLMTIGGGYVGSTIQSVAYCFTPVVGYSSFGSYVGNGNSNGPFVYTGFRPRWVLRKRSDSTGNWGIVDAVRLTYNLDDSVLFTDLSLAEQTLNPNWGIDLLSNGFKVRSSDAATNASAGTYIYAAFAESPFQSSRAR